MSRQTKAELQELLDYHRENARQWQAKATEAIKAQKEAEESLERLRNDMASVESDKAFLKRRLSELRTALPATGVALGQFDPDYGRIDGVEPPEQHNMWAHLINMARDYEPQRNQVFGLDNDREWYRSN